MPGVGLDADYILNEQHRVVAVCGKELDERVFRRYVERVLFWFGLSRHDATIVVTKKNFKNFQKMVRDTLYPPPPRPGPPGGAPIWTQSNRSVWISHFGLEMGCQNDVRIIVIMLNTAYLCGFQQSPPVILLGSASKLLIHGRAELGFATRFSHFRKNPAFREFPWGIPHWGIPMTGKAKTLCLSMT